MRAQDRKAGVLGQRALLVVLAIVFLILVAGCPRMVSEPGTTEAGADAAGAAAQLPAEASATIASWGDAERVVRELLQETEGLEAPGILPLPASDKEGKDFVLALEGLADGTPPPPHRPQRAVTIGLTGNWKGDVDPCGCLKNPLGGLARLATYWQRILEGRQNTILIDAGGTLLSDPLATHERPGEIEPRTNLYAKVFQKLGYRAMNVSSSELMLGLPRLRAFGKEAGLTLLSANLLDAKTGKPVFEPMTVVEAGPVKIALIGLLSQSSPELGKAILEKGLQVADPVAVVRKLVPQARAQGANLIAIVTQLRRTELELLAEAVPEINLILGSGDGELTLQPHAVGKDAYFVDVMNKGKYLGVITLEIGAVPHQLHAAKMQEVLREQARVVAAELQSMRNAQAYAETPEGAAGATPESRAETQRQIAKLQARLQRLTLQAEAGASPPVGASTIDLHQQSMNEALPDDPVVGKWLDKHHERFPAPERRAPAAEVPPGVGDLPVAP